MERPPGFGRERVELGRFGEDVATRPHGDEGVDVGVERLDAIEVLGHHFAGAQLTGPRCCGEACGIHAVMSSVTEVEPVGDVAKWLLVAACRSPMIAW